MIRLFPRLPRSVATKLAQQHSTASIDGLLRDATPEHPALSFAPTGGTRITKDELRDLVEGLRMLARDCGYPEPRSRASNDDFDAKAGRFLHEESGLTLTEACRDEVWNFVGCLLAPDVVRWRFPGERTTPNLFLGRDRGVDSALGRCWWAAEILADEQAAGDPYHLLFTLGVDETVGFSRRVTAVVNRRVAVALARASLWVEQATELPFPRLDLSRDLMKRFLRSSAIVSFESLGSDELEAVTRGMAMESARALCVDRGLDFVERRTEDLAVPVDPAEANPLTEIISGIALSSRSVSRFDGVKQWFESELALPEGSVAVKYLADAKNYRNRIGEALRHRPRVLVLLYTEGDDADVVTAFGDRAMLSPRTVAVTCARGPDAVWSVTSIASIADATDTPSVRARFPLTGVQEIERRQTSDLVDADELRRQLEEGFADLYREADDLMDVSVSRLLQATLEVPATAIRGKHVPDAKNLGNRISEALGTGCHAVVVSVPDTITNDAIRILQAQIDGLGYFVVGAVLSKAAGDWSRPAQLVLPQTGETGGEEATRDDADPAPSPRDAPSGSTQGDQGVSDALSELVSDHPVLGRRYHKLLVRLGNLTGEEPTFRSVAALDPSWFLAQAGVGTKYATDLERLQGELIEGKLIEGNIPAEGSLASPPSLPDVPVHLNFGELSHEERRAHAKFNQLLGRDPTVADFLDFSAAEYANRQGVGRKTLRALEHVQNRLTQELADLANEESISPSRRGLLVFERPDSIDLVLATELLEENVQAALEGSPEREGEIFCARSGFGEPVRTLTSIGAELGISRERVRQLGNSFMDELRRSSRVHPNVLRVLVVDATAKELADEMASFARRFDGNAEFLDFIETFCSLEAGTLTGSTKYEPPASATDVNELFVRHPSPMARGTLVDLLESDLGVPAADASSFIGWLIDEGRLSSEGDSVRPRSLTKVQAVAHVLLDFEDGLPFQEVARLVNERGLVRVEMDETRSASYFTDSPWVYVYGQGRYRHIDFFPLDESAPDELLPRVRSLLLSWGVESANLQRIHGVLEPGIEYFDLRHLVSSQGERFGLFFTGASRVDTVALRPDADTIPIHEMIYRMIAGAEEAVPLEAVAGTIRSAAVAKASVSRLVQEGRIVSVDGGYRTTEDLLTSADSSRLVQLIDEILREPGPPVIDADVVRERANVVLGVKRGRDFYVSALRALAAKGGWRVRRTLFARGEIQWSSLRDVVRECAELVEDNDAAIELVSSKVRLTDAVIRTSVRNALGGLRWKLGGA